MGIQDFNHNVQKAVNRIQSEDNIFKLSENIKGCKYDSFSIDLIYGLPFQTVDSLKNTLDKVIELSPDRISVFSFAYMPTRFKSQVLIDSKTMPSSDAKLDLLQLCIEKLCSSGYVYIGMDHFAKKNDSLTLAMQNKSLHRNFQGYSTNAACDLIGLGVSAIGNINNHYSQNIHSIKEYQETLKKNIIPINKGLILNKDDILRKEIITELICHFNLSINTIEEKYNLDFNKYFFNELEKCKPLVEDELIDISKNNIKILPKGRLLIRNICSTFDKYYSATHKSHSKAI